MLSAFTMLACSALVPFFLKNQMSPEETIVIFMGTGDANLKQSKTHTKFEADQKGQST